jgi:ABC-type bacteriocin/lantibiotic exporter with double-glycine peptidase domain
LVAIVGGLTAVSAALSYTLPASARYLIDRVLPAGDLALLWPVLLAVLAAYLLQQASGWIRDILSARVAESLKAEIGDRLVRHLLSLDRATIARFEVGYLAERVVGDVGVLDFLLLEGLVGVGEQIVMLAVGLGLLVGLNPTLTAVALLVLPLQIVVHLSFIRGIGRRAAAVREESARLQGAVVEPLAALTEIQRHVAEDERARRVAGQWRRSMRANIGYFSFLSAAGSLGGLVAALGPLGVIAAGTASLVRGSASLGDVVSFLAVLGVLYGPVQSMVGMRRTIGP